MRGYLKRGAVLGSAPCALGATALDEVGREGRTLQLQGDASQPTRQTLGWPTWVWRTGTKKTREERRERGSTPQKDKQWQGWVGETCASALTERSHLLALWPSGSDTGSCLLFTDTESFVELF